MQNNEMKDLAKKIKDDLEEHNFKILRSTAIDTKSVYSPRCVSIDFKYAHGKEFKLCIHQQKNKLWTLNFYSGRENNTDYVLTDISGYADAWMECKQWMEQQQIVNYQILNVNNDSCEKKEVNRKNSFCSFM